MSDPMRPYPSVDDDELIGPRQCCAERAIRTSQFGDTDWWTCPICGQTFTLPVYSDGPRDYESEDGQ